jgi:hypothetical protein
MDVPCGRCKNWLEYHYMNLDDEKKNLSMLMMGDFQHEMVNSYSNTAALPYIMHFSVLLKTSVFYLSSLNYVYMYNAFGKSRKCM